MDLDLAQVRAFVAVAEQLHFSRAAAGLHLSQQALSRRIQRLEQLVGAPLFVRNSSGVELTPAGMRFLPHARQLLAVADMAKVDVGSASSPLRVDVWGFHRLAPLRFVEALMSGSSGLQVEPSMRRNVWSAMEALLRGEVDVAFGRPHDIDRPWPGSLRRRVAQLEPAAVVVSTEHPLSRTPTIRPDQLRSNTLWVPPATTSPEVLRWFEHFAGHFGLPLRYDEIDAVIAPEAVIEQLRDDPTHVRLLPAGTSIPSDRVRVVPLIDPVPRFLWAVIWRHDDQNPSLARFLNALSEAGREAGWTAYDPRRDWLPDPDLADVRSPQRR